MGVAGLAQSPCWIAQCVDGRCSSACVSVLAAAGASPEFQHAQPRGGHRPPESHGESASCKKLERPGWGGEGGGSRKQLASNVYIVLPGKTKHFFRLGWLSH